MEKIFVINIDKIVIKYCENLYHTKFHTKFIQILYKVYTMIYKVVNKKLIDINYINQSV